MKEKLRKFLAERNGLDSLSNTLIWGCLIVMLVSTFIGADWLRGILSWLSWAGIFYAYYRVFSKNLSKRWAENHAFESWKNQLKQRWQQRKIHRFYRCPKCRTVLRVPKGKGKINITCRSCGEKFVKKHEATSLNKGKHLLLPLGSGRCLRIDLSDLLKYNRCGRIPERSALSAMRF